MLNHHMSLTKLQVVPVVAMLIAFAWAALVSAPAQSGGPYPLPSDYVASSPTQTVVN
jgi:hypothetical protein